MLAITRSRDFHGLVGMETSIEFNGVKICVGDVIHIEKGSNNNECTNIVAVFGNKIGVMGLAGTPIKKLNIIGIVQSHKVLQVGDRLDNGYFEVEEFIQ